MNHRDAVQELAVEQYLLGELSGTSLDAFEEHLFECPECTADVKTGFAFIDSAKAELSVPRRAVIPQVERAPRWTSWFRSPWVLGPALAACLALLCFETFVVQPRMREEVARAETPSILNPLVLANAGARGDSVLEVAAPEHGSFVISVDVPATGSFAGYLCSLQAPDGSIVWQTSISPEQARDALLINVPTARAREGLNTFLIQGIPSGGSSGGTLEDLATYRFRVRIQR
jgi:hypothetical protein